VDSFFASGINELGNTATERIERNNQACFGIIDPMYKDRLIALFQKFPD